MRLVGVVLLILACSPVSAQVDPDFLRAWESAQRDFPENVSRTTVIAGPGEPGTPLTIDGRVVLGDGRVIVRDAIVFAWQTDATGVYDRSQRAHSWRLRGWARTDANGRFRFITIRPGAYPGRNEPAHVHFTVQRSDGRRYFVPDLLFDDDPLLTPERRRREGIRISPVTSDAEGQHVEISLRLDDSRRF